MLAGGEFGQHPRPTNEEARWRKAAEELLQWHGLRRAACKVEGCDEPATASGYCGVHVRMRRQVTSAKFARLMAEAREEAVGA